MEFYLNYVIYIVGLVQVDSELLFVDSADQIISVGCADVFNSQRTDRSTFSWPHNVYSILFEVLFARLAEAV